MSQQEKLLNRYLEGDTQLCRQLLIAPEYLQKVKRIARKHTQGTSVSWQDAEQTAYEKVLQAAKSGKFREGGIKKFYCWAETVARCEIIDLVRKEKQFHWSSLDRKISGTELPLSETIPDKFNLLEAIERKDFILRAIEAIKVIDRRYPNQAYQKLWRGRVEGKTQTQISIELGVTQSDISKRWKKLLKYIAQELGLLPSKENFQREVQATRQQKAVRLRSDVQW